MRKSYLLLCTILLAGCNHTRISNANDITGPYINLTKYEFTTVVGKEIDFSNISAYDDVDGLMSVSIKGYINYDEAGEYYPILYSIDTSGNETDVPITVYVKDSEYVELEDTKDDSLEEESKVVIENCTKEDTDSNYPCLVVLPDVAKQYEKLYQGKKGKEYCEKDMREEDSCEVVVTNDETFWGYGLKEEEAIN